MKATVKENETFKPITIELVIESEQELCDLWLRMNLSISDVDKSYRVLPLKYCSNSNNNLWDVLDEIVNKLNLKK